MILVAGSSIMHSIGLTTNFNKITVPDIRSRPNRVERLGKTEWLTAPRPEERASDPPNSQPIRGGDEKTQEINPFPFPLGVGTIISQGKTCLKIWYGRYPEYKKLNQESQFWPDP